VGFGPEEKDLILLSKEIGISRNVVFHGDLPDQREVFSLIKSSTVFVLPSTREGFGIVVLEANACGLPVITSDHQDNAARLIAQRAINLNPKVFASEIEKALDYKLHNFSSIHKNARLFRWSTILEQLIDSYRL
jgi:glycosyltransferase involved in cell wall biosynthesis